MDASKYRTDIKRSPIDFPPIIGLAMQSIFTTTDTPKIINGKLQLKLTKGILITETDSKIEHKIFDLSIVYQIPISEIKTDDDLYEFYKDALLNLIQSYQYAQSLTSLPVFQFPLEPSEKFSKEYATIFHAINSLN